MACDVSPVAMFFFNEGSPNKVNRKKKVVVVNFKLNRILGTFLSPDLH